MNDKSNITIGLPKEGGAIFWAPAGTSIPATADEALSGSYVCLGYVTEDGVTITVTDDGDDINAWGHEIVMHAQTGYTKTATLNLLETSKPAVLQFVYGAENVTINGDGSIKWVDTGKPLPRGVFVCDTIQNNGSDTPRIHRIVFGDAQFTDRSGDHVYNNSDPLSFPIVLTAYKFDNGGKKVYDVNYLSAGADESES